MTSLQVIGAGLGRTGTMSMKAALEELGFAPCHHMKETSNHPERNHHFRTILQDVENEEAIKAVFEGFKATVDQPGNIFYETFMKLNPDAKVILTVRDSPEAWAKSARNTMFSCNNSSNWLQWKVKRFAWDMIEPTHIQLVHKIMADRKVHGVDPNNPKTDLAQMYTDWNKRVIETVPAEKLLIFNVKEGWKPLCDFLGVPIPDKPFPRVNSAEEWKEWVAADVRRAGLKFLVLVAVVGLISYAFYSFYSM